MNNQTQSEYERAINIAVIVEEIWTEFNFQKYSFKTH